MAVLCLLLSGRKIKVQPLSGDMYGVFIVDDRIKIYL